jgi:hypothetical protein
MLYTHTEFPSEQSSSPTSHCPSPPQSKQQTADNPPKKFSTRRKDQNKKNPAHKSTEIDPSLPDKIPAPHITPSPQNTRLKGTNPSPGKKKQQPQQKIELYNATDASYIVSSP